MDERERALADEAEYARLQRRTFALAFSTVALALLVLVVFLVAVLRDAAAVWVP